MDRSLRGLVGPLLLVSAAAACAHGDWQPKHGGQLNDGETTFELVARGRSVVFHLEDHGTAIETRGAQGTITVTRGDATWTRVLEPGGGNRLKAAISQPLVQGDRVLARVTLASGAIVAGRFVYVPTSK